MGLGLQASAAGLTACTPEGTAPTDNLPDRLRSQGDFVSTPEWSDEKDFDIGTNSGNIRIFNPSSWEIDTALLVEAVNRHCMGLSFERSLELRMFNDIYVVRDSTKGFGLSNEVSDADGETGLTVTSPNMVLSVIPTGWANLTEYYGSGYNGLETVITTPERYITMDTVHELIVHGCNRAANVQRHNDEELHAQIFERQIHHTLLSQDRSLVR